MTWIKLSTWSYGEEVVGSSSKDSNFTKETEGTVTYIEAVLPCGPRKGGLICPGDKMLCDVLRDVCTADTDPVDILEVGWYGLRPCEPRVEKRPELALRSA